MDFLKEIEKQSEPLVKEVQERKKDLSFFTVADDGEHILCEGAGNPNKIARSILNVLERDKSLQRAFKEEIEADIEDIKNAIDEIKSSL